MNPTDKEIKRATDKIDEYAKDVELGVPLNPDINVLEFEVENGSIWLHPNEDRTTVDIHLFDETHEGEFGTAESQIIDYLIQEIGFERSGQSKPSVTVSSPEQLTIQVNFELV